MCTYLKVRYMLIWTYVCPKGRLGKDGILGRMWNRSNEQCKVIRDLRGIRRCHQIHCVDPDGDRIQHVLFGELSCRRVLAEWSVSLSDRMLAKIEH